MKYKLSKIKILNEYNSVNKFCISNEIANSNFYTYNKVGYSFEKILKKELGRFIVDEQIEDYKKELLELQKKLIRELE